MVSGNLILLLLLFFTGALCIFVWNSDVSKSFYGWQYFKDHHGSPSSNMMNKESDELETVLMEASFENNMMNRTLFIAMVNKAYVEGGDDQNKAMLDLFIESFWVGEGTRFLLDHLLLVAVDQAAYDRCKFLRLHCYKLVTQGVDFRGEQLYMSKDFINMMWRRTSFLADVLKRGYSFIFTDTDVMWLRNPFPKLLVSKNNTDDEDIKISCDKFNGNPWSESNPINTGFYFVRSNNKTVSLFQKWYAMKDNSTYIRMKEQDVLESLLHRGVFRQLGLRARFLDTLYFSGFCQDSRDFGAVITVHANCCRSISAKVADLMAVLRDWKSFMASRYGGKKINSSNGLNSNGTVVGEIRTLHWSRHVACGKSWEGFNPNLLN